MSFIDTIAHHLERTETAWLRAKREDISYEAKGGKEVKTTVAKAAQEAIETVNNAKTKKPTPLVTLALATKALDQLLSTQNHNVGMFVYLTGNTIPYLIRKDHPAFYNAVEGGSPQTFLLSWHKMAQAKRMQIASDAVVAALAYVRSEIKAKTIPANWAYDSHFYHGLVPAIVSGAEAARIVIEWAQDPNGNLTAMEVQDARDTLRRQSGSELGVSPTAELFIAKARVPKPAEPPARQSATDASAATPLHKNGSVHASSTKGETPASPALKTPVVQNISQPLVTPAASGIAPGNTAATGDSPVTNGTQPANSASTPHTSIYETILHSCALAADKLATGELTEEKAIRYLDHTYGTICNLHCVVAFSMSVQLAARAKSLAPLTRAESILAQMMLNIIPVERRKALHESMPGIDTEISMPIERFISWMKQQLTPEQRATVLSGLDNAYRSRVFQRYKTNPWIGIWPTQLQIEKECMPKFMTIEEWDMMAKAWIMGAKPPGLHSMYYHALDIASAPETGTRIHQFVDALIERIKIENPPDHAPQNAYRRGQLINSYAAFRRSGKPNSQPYVSTTPAVIRGPRVVEARQRAV